MPNVSGSVTPTQTQTGGDLASQIVAYGARLVAMHIPYVWGGTTPGGFDCSGLTQFIYKHFGIDLPRVSQEQAKVGVTVPRNALQPGDLLFYDITGPDSHEALYAGNGQQIVARHTGTFVQFQPVGNFSHAQRVIGTSSGISSGISATPAGSFVNAGFGIPTPADVWSAIGDSLGVPSLKDMFQRLGLILLGGGLLVFGIHMMSNSFTQGLIGINKQPKKEETQPEQPPEAESEKIMRKGAEGVVRQAERNQRRAQQRSAKVNAKDAADMEKAIEDAAKSEGS